jgi:hypothetical protein
MEPGIFVTFGDAVDFFMFSSTPKMIGRDYAYVNIFPLLSG